MWSSEPRARQRAMAFSRPALAVFRDFAGARLVFHHGEGFAGHRRAVEAQHFHWLRRTGFGQLLIALVDQGADAAQLAAGDDDVAALQRAALDQDGGHRAAALVELGFDDDALGRCGPDWPSGRAPRPAAGWLRSVCRGPAGLGRNLDIWVSPPRLSTTTSCWSSALMTFCRIGGRLVDLVDGHDHRRAWRRWLC